MTEIGTDIPVTPEMTPAQMREYYLEQTRRSLEAWEKENFPVRSDPPFRLEDPGPLEFRMTPERARRIDLRAQVEAFAEEARVSTAGVRENQNVLCPWDHRYRINEYMLAMVAESLARLVPQLHAERIRELPPADPEEVARRLGPEAVAVVEEIFQLPLAEAIHFARTHPVRIVGGEVRSNTSRFVDLVSRLYAAHGLHVLLTEDRECRDTSSIFMWSFLTFLLGLSGGDYFTSSHGAPQKQSDKILAHDGSQYLPPLYARIVDHMLEILEIIEREGYTFRLASRDDPHLHRRLSYRRMARLYSGYLRRGPASPAALEQIRRAAARGLRLKLDFFGGAGYRTLRPILEELQIEQVFEGGFLRPEEDPFFHDIGFRVTPRRDGSGYEVVHDSVDASLPSVVASAGYEKLLADAPVGQAVFNVDPDVDRFVAGQVVPAAERPRLERLGVNALALGPDRVFALYSPNQFFLMLAENDRVVAVQEGSWEQYDPLDIHTYVSALAWDEWAKHHGIPVVRVPVGFKEIAAVMRRVEEAQSRSPGQPLEIADELGRVTRLGPRPKIHHAGEESGGRIGGPREPVYNLLGERILAMREKSAGEACVSAVSLMARLYLESERQRRPETLYLHDYLERLFAESGVAHPMEFRGDRVHYNEALFDPEELARAKKEGLRERDRYNGFFRRLARGLQDPTATRVGRTLTLEEVRDLLAEAIPGMAAEWRRLERIDLWSDGIQMWFAPGGKLRDLCLRPSGTDAKTKIYFDGSDKEYLRSLYEDHLRTFDPAPSERYRRLLESGEGRTPEARSGRNPSPERPPSG